MLKYLEINYSGMVILLLAVICFALGYNLLFGYANFFRLSEQKKTMRKHESYLSELYSTNDDLLQNIESAKNDLNLLEEIARHDLGLIRPNEKFYQVLEQYN